jgi:hypothetical protein
MMERRDQRAAASSFPLLELTANPSSESECLSPLEVCDTLAELAPPDETSSAPAKLSRRVPRDVVLKAREYTMEALERLGHWMRSDDSRASIEATKELLYRGWGRPERFSDPNDPRNNVNVTVNIDAFTSRIVSLSSRVAEGGGDGETDGGGT